MNRRVFSACLHAVQGALVTSFTAALEGEAPDLFTEGPSSGQPGGLFPARENPAGTASASEAAAPRPQGFWGRLDDPPLLARLETSSAPDAPEEDWRVSVPPGRSAAPRIFAPVEEDAAPLRAAR